VVFFVAGGVTLVVVSSVDRILKIRIIIERKSRKNLRELIGEIERDLGRAFPETVSLDVHHKHWFDTPGNSKFGNVSFVSFVLERRMCYRA